MLIEEVSLDWETLYCPNLCCEYYGKPFKIWQLVSDRSSRNEPQARCQDAQFNSDSLRISLRFGCVRQVAKEIIRGYPPLRAMPVRNVRHHQIYG
jgi:hypothetical protein